MDIFRLSQGELLALQRSRTGRAREGTRERGTQKQINGSK
jgi:hypothetical protein